ncbi:MAG: hypothetical protein IPJ41_07015 [Phycisphaerales bacterium]|nr:hypothetical protein [Phycisphaerales bacterium]
MRPATFPGCRLFVLAGIAGAVPLGAPAWAQGQPADGEPIILGRRETWKGFELASLTAAVNTEARYRSFRRETEGQPTLTDTERYILGEIEVGGEAYIGHRNLLDVTGTVRLGLENTNLNSDTQGASLDDTNQRTLYDVSGLILQEGPAPLTVYSRREQVQLDRQFGGTIDSVNTEHGAILRYRSEVAPTYIHYFHRESNQTDQLGTIDYDSVQDTFNIRTDVNMGDTQRLSAEYTLDLVDERQSSSYQNSFTRHDALFVHEIDFGRDARSHLRSSLRLYDESGLADLRRVRLDETLRLQHTDDFDTRYDVSAEDSQRHGQEQRYLSARFLARYKLFDSLVATGSLGASTLEVDGDASTQLYDVSGDLQYTKRVPYGRLDATIGVGFTRQEDGERGQPFLISDDRVTLEDPRPSVIARRNVVANSAFVTDSAGFRIYVEGIDYVVDYFPDHIEIRRIVGGAIADGEVVLVDYTVGPEPAATFDTPNASISARYTFEEGPLNGLSPYVVYQWLDQSVDAVDPTRFVLEELHDLKYGVDYRIGNFTFNAERQNHDSNIFPYDSTRLEARYDLRMSYSWALTGNLTREITDYSNTGEQLTLDRATLRVYGRLGEDLDLNARVEYRDESSRLAQDITGFEQELNLVLRKGKTSITGGLRNSVLDSGVSSTTSQTISVGLRRTF